MHSLPSSAKVGPSRSSNESVISLAWRIVQAVYRKLDRRLAAIAYAEAGNMDAVQVILDQGQAKNNKK